MRSVWKFPLQIIDNQLIQMPHGATLLSVQMQGDVPCLWALVDDTAAQADRHIKIIGTGNNANHVARDRFVATFQYGPLVFHVFDAGER